MKHEAVQCNRCSKPVYPIELLNRDRKTWCGCDKIDVPDGWSGFVGSGRKEKPYRRQ